MADNQQFTPPKKIAIDNRKIGMSQPLEDHPKRNASLSWGFSNNSPQIKVWTDHPEDERRTIKVGFDIMSFQVFLDGLETIAKSDAGGKLRVKCHNYTFFKQQRSDKPEHVADVLAGKDDDGRVWMCVSVAKYHKVKFYFKAHRDPKTGVKYHEFTDLEGNPITDAQESKIHALATVGVLKQMLPITAHEEYIDKSPNRQGNNGGGYNKNNNGGFNSNNGGGNQGGGNNGFGEELPF